MAILDPGYASTILEFAGILAAVIVFARRAEDSNEKRVENVKKELKELVTNFKKELKEQIENVERRLQDRDTEIKITLDRVNANLYDHVTFGDKGYYRYPQRRGQVKDDSGYRDGNGSYQSYKDSISNIKLQEPTSIVPVKDSAEGFIK